MMRSEHCHATMLSVLICDLKMPNNSATASIYVHLEGQGFKCYIKKIGRRKKNTDKI
jgi:hypothetical protein